MPTKTKTTRNRPAALAASTQKEHKPSPPPQNDNEWFELRGSPIQGLGAFARKEIPRGTRIIEYTGEKISRWIVDAAYDGNDARFINHSCDPNCDAYIERGHIWIESIKRIPAGAELAYDYQYEYLDEYTEEDLAFYKCCCGAANCRGTIVEPKKARRKR
jgi:SET domain-containing protein